ncbi:MAG: peroxiredoxin family protein [Novosphingobium sp.]|jgi:hypothetical protein
MSIGISSRRAPELRVPYWIDGKGDRIEPVRLADLGDGYKVIYCFQHWCPGCHSRGFPALKRLVDGLSDKGFGFAVVQTVFEGADQNTVEKLRETQLHYGLDLPFGHDLPPAGERYPTVMEDYRSGGTPWFIVIDPRGEVIFNDFRLDPDRLIAAFEDAPTVELVR